MKISTKSAIALAISAAFAAPLASADVVSYDVSGINSWDDSSDPFGANESYVFDVAAALGLASGSAVTITGIGWDVAITTVGLSWLSEPTVGIGGVIDLTVSGDGAPGSSAYSSGGIIDLASIPLPDILLADGLLTLDFFESYDDVVGAIDATWDSGTLDFDAFATPVPLPAAFPLLLTGLVGLFAARRRRVS